ncbi:2-succinyl-5-enolpyruvyl-6-hydroxy-3-cyclohexene-1-carboxylic-acid synthase [Gryllotalpicola protaetiae]|uniref:2-succinyl-5-enolpyruvyl-6-hydroxy-3-cyclohexene-1-carboxylate synthase n=1 Tax=Gryllotalpicola protaetiae TaxID=2419771 RepID=A0A387BS21_9MICO|nr:2-succinyl-5-enolpyruvyl-6-hydroxy-3-cyclohexene-1-carboxylic-acid synthase [Gryllotalpicola protaetiae]AYG03850.1 2-succinyl-5-enolpyruvyl-6-hydroxy-3-cyclohexene-1-carboxylic-acid synthase [Gryllotalpicola protaetiae]
MGDGPHSGVSQPSPATSNPATDFSIELLTALVRLGVRHVIVSPGSRSQALALVAAELERIGAIELHVRIDERVGGFLALGLALESGAPAVVVTTSGTAIANVHPAVMEAHEARVPMIVITADRPVELRGIRSNQTTTQPGAFGAAARVSLDVDANAGADASALAASLWASAAHGPVHLNLALRDPLSAPVPDLSSLDFSARSSESLVSAGVAGDFVTTERLAQGPRTVVIAGDKAGPAAEELARAGGWPLIAEVSSGARFGPNLVVAYRELLNDADFGGAVERAIVFGHPTLSREIPALLTRPDVEVIVVDDTDVPEFFDPGRGARRVSEVELEASVDPNEPDVRNWTGRWVFTSRRLVDLAAQRGAPVESGDISDSATRAAYLRGELAAVRESVTRRMLADAVWRFTWPRDRLVLGASRLIRVLDGTVGGKKITVHANRGLGGIDGTVATGIGVALAASAKAEDPRIGVSTPPGVTRVLLGDLTLLHDVGALLRAPGERIPPVQIVVGNDRGGTIFEGLEVAASAAPDAFERVQLTPRDVDVAALAQAYGWQYRRAATRGELDQALSAVTPEPTIIEVPLA